MNNPQPKSTPSAWSAAAAAMAALFLMSGIDGQQRVQAVFLFLALVCLALQHLAPLLRKRFDSWLRTHPIARDVLLGGGSVWR